MALRVVFMGTPAFSVPTLAALATAATAAAMRISYKPATNPRGYFLRRRWSHSSINR